jgi:hypothetical protein
VPRNPHASWTGTEFSVIFTDDPLKHKPLVSQGFMLLERAKRLELSTYSMASCRSSQLSYARLRGEDDRYVI